MNLLYLALQSLRQRALHTFLCVLMTAFSVMAGVMIILASGHVHDRIERDTAGVDLVVGAPGSPLQIILSSLYHIDIPTGNLEASVAADIARDPAVAQSIPLALGDNVKGFRIAGTTPDFIALYGGVYDTGQVWQGLMQAVAGATAAHALGMSPGTRFSGAHGLAEGGHHHEETYQVTGILKPTGTVIDRLILTSVASVQDLHEHAHDHHHEDDEHAEGEITALLVKVRSPRDLINFPRALNRDGLAVAASPAMELARITSALGLSSRIVMGVAVGLMLMAALSIFSGLASSLQTRAHDIAVMRLLGMPRHKIFALMMLESFLTTMAGLLAGLAAGHIGFAAMADIVPSLQASQATGAVVYISEVYLAGAVLLAGLCAALVPACRAFRLDAGRLLMSGAVT